MSFLDELIYLFPSSKLDFFYNLNHDSEDTSSRVSNLMLVLWSNFIKGGFVYLKIRLNKFSEMNKSN